MTLYFCWTLLSSRSAVLAIRRCPIGPCTRQFDFDFVRQCRHTGNRLAIFSARHMSLYVVHVSQSDHAVLHRYCYVRASILGSHSSSRSHRVAIPSRFSYAFPPMSVFWPRDDLASLMPRAHRASLRAAIIVCAALGLALGSSTGRASNSVSAAFDSVSEYRPPLATSASGDSSHNGAFCSVSFRHILSGRSSHESRMLCSCAPPA